MPIRLAGFLGAASMLSKMPPGSIIQTAYAEYPANANLTVVIPSDDTIPQWTEGTEILSCHDHSVFSDQSNSADVRWCFL